MTSRQGQEEDEEETIKRKREQNVDFLYAILKVDRTASLTEIQNAYKRLTRSVHPDKVQQQAQQQQNNHPAQISSQQQEDDNKEHAENCFVLVKQAHDVLTDPMYRLAYNHGGLLAVELVKRSQQVDATRRAAAASRSQSSFFHNSSDTNNDGGGAHLEDDDFDSDSDDDYDDDEYNEKHPNLYKRLEYAQNQRDAIQIIENLLEEYHLHIWESQQTPLHASVAFHQAYHEFPNDDDVIPFQWSRLQTEATSSMSLSTQRSITKQMDCSCSWNGQVDRTGAADLTSRLFLGYRPRATAVAEAQGGGSGAGGAEAASAAAAAAASSSYYAVDISLNQGASYLAALQEQRQERLQRQQGSRQQQQQQQQHRPPLHYTFQTTRRFHGKTLVQVAVGGSSLTSLQSWSYTLSSSRLIILGSLGNMFRNSNNDNDNQEPQEEEDVHLHASWQAAFSMAHPTSVHALAGTVRNLTYPQYKVRLAPLSLFLVSADGGSNGNGNAAMSSSPALKLTVDSAASHAWHLAIAWHWWLWRIKVTKEQPLSRLFSWKSGSFGAKEKQRRRHAGANNNPNDDDEKPHHDAWLIKYGFKFDFHEWISRGVLGNSRNHWGLLLQLSSAANDAWNIRIPIDILQYNSLSSIAAETIMPPIVSTWIAFLLGQWLEDVLESTFLLQRTKNTRHKKPSTCVLSTTPRVVQENATTALLSSSSTNARLRYRRRHHAVASPPRYVETIRQVAALKRQLEKQKPNDQGLVILQATIWRSPSGSPSSASGSREYDSYYYLDDDSHYLRQEDVTDLLQFWVIDSQLPRLYLANGALLSSRHHRHRQRGGEQQWWCDWLCCGTNTNMNNFDNDYKLGLKSSLQQLQSMIGRCYEKLWHTLHDQGCYYRQYLLSWFQRVRGDKNGNDNSAGAPEDVHAKSRSNTTVMATIRSSSAATASRLYIRYQYDGQVYEIEFLAPAHQDCQQQGDHVTDHYGTDATKDDSIWLPHPRAVLMGSASRVQ